MNRPYFARRNILQEVLFMLELEQYKYSLSQIEEAIKEIEVSL